MGRFFAEQQHLRGLWTTRGVEKPTLAPESISVKTYNRCPSCNRKPVVSVRKSIVGTSDIANIEIEELYTKVVNKPTYYGELAVCFNCRLVHNKLFFDPAELRYIYAKAYVEDCGL